MIDKKKIYDVLNQEFGYDNFKTGQYEVLQHLLTGENALAVLPTGGGKTLIYQMFGMLNSGSVIVVSPLLSLIKDQINRLRMNGEKRIAEINSTVDFIDLKRQLTNLNKYKYIFTSPESLQRDDVQTAIEKVDVSLMVIDEAHCISQWGKSFRPDYLKLGMIRQQLNNPLTLMLTATASKQTRKEILASLNVEDCFQFITSVNRKNIFLDYVEVEQRNQKETALLNLLSNLNGSGIIYFSSRKVADEYSSLINTKTSFKSAPYHAGMDSSERYKVQNQFQDDELNIICATSAFGMGIDKSNIRFVIHYHMPANIENYVQEIGRAGRDGKQSVAILLYAPGDEKLPELLSNASIPVINENPLNEDQKNLLDYYTDQGLDQQQITALFKDQVVQNNKSIRKMLELIRNDFCHRQVLLNYFDEDFEDHNDDICCGRITDFKKLKLEATQINNSSRNNVFKPWKEKLNEIFNI